jgi:hypothetical protein
VLLSTPLHASSNFTVSVQLANKRGLKNAFFFFFFKVKFMLRMTVSQSVLVPGTHLGPATNFPHSLFDYF